MENQAGMTGKKATLEQLRSALETASLPKHLAIIMDGNGRWALRRGLPRIAGHKRGVDIVRTVTEACRKVGISVLTLYAFSDENWGRPKEEVGFLMDLLGSFLKAEISNMKTNNIRFQTIGRIERLPSSARKWIDRAKTETAMNTGMVLNLALSYGGRGEILEAIKRLRAANGSEPVITEEVLSAYLDTAGLPILT